MKNALLFVKNDKLKVYDQLRAMADSSEKLPSVFSEAWYSLDPMLRKKVKQLLFENPHPVPTNTPTLPDATSDNVEPNSRTNTIDPKTIISGGLGFITGSYIGAKLSEFVDPNLPGRDQLPKVLWAVGCVSAIYLAKKASFELKPSSDSQLTKACELFGVKPDIDLEALEVIYENRIKKDPGSDLQELHNAINVIKSARIAHDS
jgi:hypothetical protein